MTLFGFGTAAIDIRISTADLGIDYRAKLLARSTRMFGGGAVANCLVQAARLGASVEWLGKLGGDPVGRRIVADLNACGVGTRHLLVDENALSPFNVAVYAGDDDRRVGGFLLPNCLADLAGHEVTALASKPGAGDWCVVEVGEVPLPLVIDFCTQVAAGGASILLDVDLDPVTQCSAASFDLVEELFRLAECLLPNSEALGSLYPGLGPEELTRHLSTITGKPVVVTAGSNGAHYSTDGLTSTHVPAFPVDVVDPVGAGDAFHGALAWALMSGSTLAEAVHVASVCGAANCTAFGARAGMLDAAALAEKMKRIPESA